MNVSYIEQISKVSFNSNVPIGLSIIAQKFFSVDYKHSYIAVYVQEMGRAGRDGQPATATLYFNASDIASNVNTLQQDMRELCKTKDCKRQFLASYFMHEHTFSGSLHSCCSSCETLCSCELCNAANNFDAH